MKLFERVSNIGLIGTESQLTRFRVRLLNQSSVILSLVAHVLFFQTILTDGPALEWNVFVVMLPYIPLALNSSRKFLHSFFFVRIIFPLLTFMLYLLFGEGLGVNYIFFISIVAAFVFNDSVKFIIWHLIFLLSLFIFAKIYINYVIPPYDDTTILLDSIASLIGTVAIIGLFILESMSVLRKQNQDIIDKIEKLKIQNESLNLMVDKNNFNNELLAILAHDLHSPANAFNQLANKISYLIKKRDDTQLLALAGYFEKTAKTVFGELENLLDWVMLQRDKITPQLQNLSLADFINSMIEHLQVYENKNQIKIKFECPADLNLHTDKNILKIILRNLLQNSLKYATPHSDLFISCQLKENNLVIMMRDTGPGLSPEILIDLKNEKSLHKDLIKGHGLGIVLSISLLKTISGTITFENYDQGLIVFISLPI